MDGSGEAGFFRFRDHFRKARVEEWFSADGEVHFFEESRGLGEDGVECRHVHKTFGDEGFVGDALGAGDAFEVAAAGGFEVDDVGRGGDFGPKPAVCDLPQEPFGISFFHICLARGDSNRFRFAVYLRLEES